MDKQYIHMAVSSIEENNTKSEIESMITDAEEVVDFIIKEMDKYLDSESIKEIGCNKVGLGLGYGVFIDEEEITKAGLNLDDFEHKVDSRKVLKDIVSIDILGPDMYLDLYNEDHLRIYFLDEIGTIIPKPDKDDYKSLETNKRFIVSHSKFIEELNKRGQIDESYKQYIEEEYKRLRKYPNYECWIELSKKRQKEIESPKVLKKDKKDS